MDWLDGEGLRSFKDADQATRNQVARILFEGWWSPLTHLGVIHGDPHLGNYSFAEAGGQLNLLDFGCVRIFPPRFVGGVVRLYRAIVAGDNAAEVAAYEAWGFKHLSQDLAGRAGDLGAATSYGPLLDDRARAHGRRRGGRQESTAAARRSR